MHNSQCVHVGSSTIAKIPSNVSASTGQSAIQAAQPKNGRHQQQIRRWEGGP